VDTEPIISTCLFTDNRLNLTEQQMSHVGRCQKTVESFIQLGEVEVERWEQRNVS
jgi:hypothetical protein